MNERLAAAQYRVGFRMKALSEILKESGRYTPIEERADEIASTILMLKADIDALTILIAKAGLAAPDEVVSAKIAQYENLMAAIDEQVNAHRQETGR